MSLSLSLHSCCCRAGLAGFLPVHLNGSLAAAAAAAQLHFTLPGTVSVSRSSSTSSSYSLPGLLNTHKRLSGAAIHWTLQTGAARQICLHLLHALATHLEKLKRQRRAFLYDARVSADARVSCEILITYHEILINYEATLVSSINAKRNK